MRKDGLVTLNGSVVGSFVLDSDTAIIATFDNRRWSFPKLLQRARHNGESIAFTITPNFEEDYELIE